MVTFNDLARENFGGIRSLAEGFESLVRNWGLSSEITGDVITPLQASGWRGDAAERASVTIVKVRNEIDAAFEEASGIAKALRSAHTELSAARADLDAAVKKAADLSMTVDHSTGSISWPAPKTSVDKSDPQQYHATFKKLAQEVAGDIAKALTRAATADAAAVTALSAVTGKDKTAFKPAPNNPEEQAKQAADILKLAGNVTDAQLDQLNKALKEHANDPRFTTAFYQNLGPDGFLKYYGQLALASADKGGRRPQAIEDLQKNLGTALATATNTRNYPRLSDEWEAGLRRAGSARADIFPPGKRGSISAQPFGYQILTNILRTGTYDAHFLNPIAEHVTQLSQLKGFWTSAPWIDGDFDQLRFLGHPGASRAGGFNPMAGVLEALAHNPQAALQYFHDPATAYDFDGSVKAFNQKNGYFDVLAKGGDDSPLQDVWKGHYFPGGHAESSGALAFGHALEAAATGRAFDAPQDTPLPQHTPEMSKLMKEVVERFGNTDGPALLRKDGAFADLAPSLGHLTADYMGDVQKAVTPYDKLLTTYGSPADLDRDHTAKLLGALGRNPEAFGAIAQAQQAYTTAHIQDIMLNRDAHGAQFTQAVNNAAHSGGAVAGIITAARTDTLVGDLKGQEKAYNDAIDRNAMWGKSVWSMTGGKLLGMVPGVGPGLSLPVNYFIDHEASSYHISLNAADPAMKAEDAGLAGATEAVKKAVENAAQGTGIPPLQVEDLSTGAANQSWDGMTGGAGLFTRAISV
ncbi:hypothetical protein ACPC54_02335 [Kitasatospora sp. NPDC094028]